PKWRAATIALRHAPDTTGPDVLAGLPLHPVFDDGQRRLAGEMLLHRLLDDREVLGVDEAQEEREVGANLALGVPSQLPVRRAQVGIIRDEVPVPEALAR